MQRIKIIGNYTMLLIAIVILALMICLNSIICPSAKADGAITDFSETYVMDDLATASIEGKLFDISDYPYVKDAPPDFLTVSEYCFSEDSEVNKHYGLFIYVYNAGGVSLVEVGNSVQIAIEYVTSSGEQIPLKYASMQLELCSVSNGDADKNRFLKYRVIDPTHKILYRVLSTPDSRIYTISGITLKEVGARNGHEYTVGGTYIYSGFAKGCGADKSADSTLTSCSKELTVLELDLHSTTFRTQSSDLGKDHRNQLNSVYFAIPDTVLKKYGVLSSVRAEWYEYNTKFVRVTDDQSSADFFNGGTYGNTNSYPYIFNTLSNFRRYYNSIDLITIESKRSEEWCNNEYFPLPLTAPHYASATGKSGIMSGYYTSDINSYISSEDVLNWFYNHDITHGGFCPCLKFIELPSGKKLPLCMISGSLDNDISNSNLSRKVGHYDIEISSKDSYNLLSYSDTHSWWDKTQDYGLWNTLFGKTPTDDGIHDIQPIVGVTETNYGNATAEILANELYVNEHDVDTFFAYCKSAWANRKTPYLFRFGVTDYYATVPEIENGVSSYLMQQRMFFDFDIIELTFEKDGNYVLIPAVASPIDIVGGIEPGLPFVGEEPWWFNVIKIVLLILVVSLLLWLIRPFLSIIGGVMKCIWAVICTPFKGILKAVKRQRKR